MLGVKLVKNKKMSLINNCVEFIKPKKVYIPLISGNDTDLTLLVKKGDYVYKGSVVARRKGKFRIPLHSSVSGHVLGTTEKTVYSGKKVKSIVIENDFLEKYEEKKTVTRKLNKYSKQEFITMLKDCGIVGMGGSGFPTYVKYNSPTKIKTLIVNAVESEPYTTSDYQIFKNNCEEILETIDAIMDINDINETFIAVKKSNVDLINHINNFIGTYLRIKLVVVPDLYRMGYEKSLIEYIKKTTYDSTPINIGIVVNNISTIYSIYEVLKYKKPLSTRVITFSGEMFKNPCNVKVKIGTQAKDVIKMIGGYTEGDNIYFIAGGPMMGNTIDTDQLVITANLTSIVAIDANKKEELDGVCISCGKCTEHCLAKLSPSLIFKNVNNDKYLKQLHPEKCVGCGLCSYVCPARIEVRNYVKQAAEKVVNK